VASAAPTARPATPSPDAVIPVISIVSREQPEFPREAMRAGIESGSVRVKLTIAANGDVSNVAILAANPPRVFDRSVKASLARWKFNPGSEGRGYETEVAFALQK
jgi:TonB family protein